MAINPIKVIRREALVVIFFIFLTIIMTYPWILHLGTGVHIGADSYFIIWAMGWDIHQLQKNPLDLFNTNIFYPHQNTLAYSENFIGNAVLLAWPVIILTGNPVLAYNLIIFLFLVLGAYCMYLLIHYLTKNTSAALLGGVIFGFNPFRFIHFSQLHLEPVFFFPLLILLLYKLVKNPCFKYFTCFTILFILAGYMSMHYFLMMGVMTAIALIIFFWIFLCQKPTKDFLLKFLLSVIFIGLAIWPIFSPYIKLKQTEDFTRSYFMINRYSPTVTDYLAFSPILRHWFNYPKTIEKFFYIGFTVLFLLIASLIYLIKKFYRQRNIMNNLVFFISIGVSFLLLSFGVLIRITENDPGIIGPYLLLYKFVPAFSGLRALGRFDILVLLAISAIIGLAAGQFFSKIRKKLFSLALVAVLIGMIILEYFWVPPFLPLALQEVKLDQSIPAVYQWLAKQEGDFAIIELPIGGDVTRETKRMYYSIYHWKNLTNGYSGYFPKDYIELEKIMSGFPDLDSVRKIKELGVRYIIVHFDSYQGARKPDDVFGLTEVTHFDNDYVYSI